MPKHTMSAPLEKGVIYRQAYFHDKVNRCVGWVPEKLDLTQQLDDMKGDGFQFFRASPEWYVAIRSTLHQPTETERRGYVANLALVFDQTRAKELLENPFRLAALKKVMGEVPHEKLAALDQSAPWTVWPDEIMNASVRKRVSPTPLVKDLLRVVIANLLGEGCYALVEGGDEDMLTMLSLLPMKFRLAAAFSAPYAGGRIRYVNNVSDVHQKLNGVPASRKYLIDQANAGNVQVSPRAERLVASVLELPTGVLGKLDSLARDEQELVKLMEVYECMRDGVKTYNRKVVTGLSWSYPEEVATLLPLLDNESAEKWNELSHPRQRSGVGRRSLETKGRKPIPLGQARHIAVAGIMVLALLAYLLLGTSVVPAEGRVYFSIIFAGGDLVKLLLGAILGFCGGYLCFWRK